MLIKTIDQDLITSLRDRQREKTAVLRMLKTGLKNFSIAKKIPEAELTDEQVVGIIRQEAKKRKESVAAFTNGGRKDLADKEAGELTVLESYLPPSLSSDEIEKYIKEVITEKNLAAPYQFGVLMGQVMKKVSGRADGDTVKHAVEAFITSG